MKEQLQEAFKMFWESIVTMSPLIITALIVFILFFILGKVVSRIFKKYIAKRWSDQIVSGFIAKALRWSFYVIGFIICLHILGFGGVANSLLAGAGVSAILVGFAFKDIAENFLSGVLLAVNRPFNVDDIIEINGFKGTVKSLDLRNTYIRNSEGKDIFVPNSIIVKNVLTNYTKDGLLRMDFDIDVDFNTDLQKMRKLIINYLLKQEDILKDPQPNLITHSVDAMRLKNKIIFWINIFHDTKNAPDSLGEPIKGRVVREVTTLLLKNKIRLAAPVVSHHTYEPENHSH